MAVAVTPGVRSEARMAGRRSGSSAGLLEHRTPPQLRREPCREIIRFESAVIVDRSRTEE